MLSSTLMGASNSKNEYTVIDNEYQYLIIIGGAEEAL
jgi:hypothetical protein